jgi:hypothetical protein
MASELRSTARPTLLRLLGFAALALGALLAGLGATMTWATIGFPNDVTGRADVAVKGTDVWEGVVVLAVAVAALVATIAMRVARPGATRSIVAGAVAIGGALVVALAGLDLATATDRFGGRGGLADIAAQVADRLGQPVERVRLLLEQNFGATLRVDTGAGLVIALAGGALIAIGGLLSLVWARAPAVEAPSDPSDVADPG